MEALHAAVTALIREVAATILLPRFRALDEGDIEEKAPGDLVTVADRESEARLADALARLLPGSSVVGEEAVAADPALRDRIGHGAVWIVDPLDGTGNFAAGRAPFAIMVALAEGGETRAGWILDPLSGRLCHARAGGGAFVDGERIVSRGSGAARPIGALATRYLPADLRAKVDARAEGHIDSVPVPHCAGEQYARVALGANDVALFWRTLPWDHAPGALFLTEAGGRVARTDGSPYRPDQDRPGLLAAATPALWDEAAERLFGQA